MKQFKMADKINTTCRGKNSKVYQLDMNVYSMNMNINSTLAFKQSARQADKKEYKHIE